MFWPTSKLKQCWEVPCKTYLESQLGKYQKQSAPWVRLQRQWFGIPFIIQGQTQTNIIISLWPNCKPGFMLMMFCLVKLGFLLSPGFGCPGCLQGLNNLKILPPSYLRCCKSCTHSRQSFPVMALSRQVWSKVRDLLCFVSEAQIRLFI